MKQELLSRLFWVLAGFIFFTTDVQGQVLTRRSSTGVTVDKSGLSGIDSGIPILTLPSVNTDQLSKEDELGAKLGQPFRFGTNIATDVHLTQAGRLTQTNGYRVFQYRIFSAGAYSLNAIFDHFRLATGARLYLYDPNRTTVIGPITDQQNPATGEYWTDIIAGDQLVIELQEPANSIETSDLHLSSIVHGYKNLFQKVSQDKVFNSSGSCEINMACYPNLQAEADGVVMILLDQATRLCTGSIVNNTQQDFRSFLLTAFHCVDQGVVANNVRTGQSDGSLSSGEIAQAQNWLIRFNYQSATCTPSQEDYEVVTLNGSALRASYYQSDFALFEIFQQIPTDVNTTYLGWNQANATASNAFAIHHPQGDVKKISFTNADSQISGYGSASGTDHLTAFWGSLGVTESGSSGAPLFDSNRRIVGQLHGGPSYCGATGNNLRDYFGRFFTSWTGGGSSTTRLSDWLDPTASGSQTTTSVKPTVSGPSAFTNTGTFSVNAGSSSIVSWSVTGSAGGISPTSGSGSAALLTALSANSSFTITFTINSGQPYPIRFTKAFTATVPPPTPPMGGITSQTATAGFVFSMTVPAFTDTRTLTYTTTPLPAGLSFNPATRVISGMPSTTGISSVTVTATNSVGLSASATFMITVIPAGPLTLLEPSYNCTTRQFTFQTSGGTGVPVQFMAVGVTGWTTATSFILDEVLANDPNAGPLTIYARQDNTFLTRTFDFRLYCIDKSPNQPPVAPSILNQSATMGQSFNFTVPPFSDDQPLSYSAVGLPSGLTFNATSRQISGEPFITGVSTVTITATDTEGASARVMFSLTVYAPGSAPALLSLTAPTYNCQTGAITFNTTGGDGTTIEYMAVGVTGWSTNPNQVVESGVRNDPNAAALVLRARQSGNVVTREFNVRQYCVSAGQNYAPIAPTIPSQTALAGQPFSYTIPAFSDDQSLNYVVSGIPSGLSFNFQKLILSGTPTYAGNYNVTITAVDPYGLYTSATLVLYVYTTAPAAFTIIDPLYNCTTRQLTFRTSGGNGSSIQYMSVGVTAWTSNPVQYIEEAVVADPNNQTIQLNARQNGVLVSRVFNFRQACGAAREATTEPTQLQITVLGNPTHADIVEAEITGAAGQPLTIRVTDTQGRVHSEHLIKSATGSEQIRMRLGQSAGIYLLQVNATNQRRTVRVLKAE